MKTHAAVLWGRGEDWRIEEIDLDPPKSHEVLVKWAAAGLCHSDEHLRASDMGSAPPSEGAPPRPALFPMVGGHEGGGVVLEVGPDVDSVRPGDHVAASFFPICGRCKMCITGHSNLCDLGAATFAPGQISDGTARYHLDGQDLNVMAKLGTFAEHSVAHEASLVPVDPDVPLGVVALVSCGVTTGWGSAVYRAEVKPGDTVVVVGVGGVGINAVQGAHMVGARNIVASDSRARKTRRFGWYDDCSTFETSTHPRDTEHGPADLARKPPETVIQRGNAGADEGRCADHSAQRPDRPGQFKEEMRKALSSKSGL